MKFLNKIFLLAALNTASFAAYAAPSNAMEDSMLALIFGGIGIVSLLVYRVHKEKSFV